jgi:hypothetical protein
MSLPDGGESGGRVPQRLASFGIPPLQCPVAFAAYNVAW